MSPARGLGAVPESIRLEAADWFARMHGPDAAAHRAGFARWHADPAHARAYDQLTARWEQSAFVGATATGRARRLRRLSPVERHPLLSAAAAFVAVAGGVTLFTTSYHRLRPATVQAVRAPVVTFVAEGARREIGLADGSHVTLDRESILLAAYSASTRSLSLERGRARFAVAHDSRRPFVVRAGASEIIAHGTLFDVSLKGDAATVSLLRGSISVRHRTLAGPPKALHAGQRVIVTGAAAVPEPEAIPPDAVSWLADMVPLAGMPLSEAAARIRRKDGPGIRFEDDTAQLRITGAFAAGDLPEFARAAATLFNLTLTQDKAGMFILARPLSPAPKKIGG